MASNSNPQYTVTPGRRQRVYVHDRCGNGTAVSGRHLPAVANPYAYTPMIVCATCEMAAADDCVWEDTGETLSAYRKRIRGYGPGWIRFIFPFAFMFVLTIIGFFVGLHGNPKNGDLSPMAAGIILACIVLLGSALVGFGFLRGLLFRMTCPHPPKDID